MCCLWLCRSLSLYLTRVKMNVGMFAAVAAFCGSHQCSRVCSSTVKFYSAGGVIGGTGCYVAVLSCHLNSVETCLTSLRPGEIPLVGPTVHMSSEVGWLTWDWRRKADFRLGFFLKFLFNCSCNHRNTSYLCLFLWVGCNCCGRLHPVLRCGKHISVHTAGWSECVRYWGWYSL